MGVEFVFTLIHIIKPLGETIVSPKFLSKIRIVQINKKITGNQLTMIINCIIIMNVNENDYHYRL